MAIHREHELHKRRLSMNVGIGLTLAAFVALIFGITIVTFLIIHLAPGQTLQAWVQNQGQDLGFAQGTPVSVHFPVDALRVLVDTTSLEQLQDMEEPQAAL